MRPVRFTINVTLDGCCDHRAGIPNEALHRHAAEGLARADALVFGRVTYGMMEEAWHEPGRTGKRPDWMAEWMLPFARTMDAAKKYVVSRTLREVDWNAELVRGDPATFVRQLRQQDGNGLAIVGTKLALALADHDLIDEYELIVHPMIAGHGPTLFAGLAKRIELKLVERRDLGAGLFATTWVPAR